MNRQTALVVKIANELKDFDNIFYEVINEPYHGNVADNWQTEIITKIVETENSFSKKHLIAKNVANNGATITNLDSSVSIVNFHYADPVRAVTPNLALNKVLGDGETGFGGTVIVKALAEDGNQYAIWVRNGTAVSMDLSLPTGNYKADWINTQTGATMRTDCLTSNSSAMVTLNSPNYTDNDTALRINSTTATNPTPIPTQRPTPTLSIRPSSIPSPIPTIRPTAAPCSKEVRIVNVPRSSSVNSLAIDAILESGQTHQGEISSALSYNVGWIFDSNAGYQEGRARWTRSAGATVTYFTNSNQITLFTKMEDGTRSFDLFVNGIKLGNYSVNASTPRFDSITINLAETSGPEPTPSKPGDANSDGKIDGIDYVIWLINYGR